MCFGMKAGIGVDTESGLMYAAVGISAPTSGKS